MSLHREYTFDRHSDLPSDGEWVNEPDKVQWVDPSTDLDCLIVRNHLGAWCGYVGVPSSHPLHGLNYDSLYDAGIHIGVHGGLTFSNSCHEDAGDDAICHVPFEGRDPDVWWFGFDCNHAGDLSPAFHKHMKEVGVSLTMFNDEVYRNQSYVTNQTEHLAEQLQEIGEP